VNDKFEVINAYPEVVREEGNKKAQALIDSYFEVVEHFGGVWLHSRQCHGAQKGVL